MMGTIDTDLMKHPAQRHTAPTSHERQAHKARREARRVAFFAFVEQVFTQAPRYPKTVIEHATPQID